jgi:Ser/Thr protein kinase RdoA (MazF antagonist)
MLLDSIPTIETWLPSHYRFTALPTVELIRSHTNDVFLVTDGPTRYVLKVYAPGWRRDSEVLYEIELIRHIAAKGVRVAGVVTTLGGAPMTHLELAGHRRQVVLFEFAAGEKPKSPFTLEMYHREGRAAAALHAATDDFASPHQRRPLDLRCLIDKPRSEIASAEGSSQAKRYLDQFGQHLRDAIDAFAEEGLDWGPCHGDLTFDNFHLTTDDQTVWYDFDSGGPGWRAVDLQGWVVTDPAMQERQDAFVAGYRAQRAIGDRDIAASAFLGAALEYWGVQIDLVYRVRRGGSDAVRAYLDEAVAKLDPWRLALGFRAD